MGVVSAHTTCGQKLAVLYFQFDSHYFWQEAIYSFKHGICEVWCAHKPVKLPITYSLGKKLSEELLAVIVTTQDCCLEFSSIAGTVWRSFVFLGPFGRPCLPWRKAILKWRPFLWAPDTPTLTQVRSTVLEDVSWSDMYVMIGIVFWNQTLEILPVSFPEPNLGKWLGSSLHSTHHVQNCVIVLQ